MTLSVDAEVRRDRGPDLRPRALERHRRVLGQRADAVAVDQREQPVDRAVAVGDRELAARDARGDRLARTTRACARRAARRSGAAPGRRAACSHSSTHSIQSSRSAPGARQALVDHRAQALGGATRLVVAADADVAGQLVGVLERLGQQRVARGEVVVQQRGGDAGLHRDPGDPHVVDPLARDQLDGGVEDARPRAARAAARVVVHAAERYSGGAHDAQPSARARSSTRS